MEWLNYHHLLYFWTVAREGSLVAAGKVLRLSHPTISAQIHALEDRLGEKLFARVGRRLAMSRDLLNFGGGELGISTRPSTAIQLRCS